MNKAEKLERYVEHGGTVSEFFDSLPRDDHVALRFTARKAWISGSSYKFSQVLFDDKSAATIAVSDDRRERVFLTFDALDMFLEGAERPFATLH